ncbi:MAG TPA: peptidoglycan recognition family protein [Pirellulales bacterium]|jgi:hypothetical protein|nr:peptidoglycan recognition family protein [Pirellulales bacterium]
MLTLNAFASAMILALVASPAARSAAFPASLSRPTGQSKRNVGRPVAMHTEEVAGLEPRAAARPWKSIVLHHSATASGNVASIDAVHRRQKDRAGKPWLGIGYHFVVGNGHLMGDGEIQPTFRWRDQLPGAHAGRHEYNDYGIGICLIGNFDETEPTAQQLAALGTLVSTLARRYSIPSERVVRHQDVQATLCPGRHFHLDRLLASSFGPAEGP